MNEPFQRFKSRSRLRPECQRAIGELREALKSYHLYCIRKITMDILTHDTRWFIDHKLSKDKLPITTEWGWNQSNSKSTVYLDDTFILELYKYHSIRKIPNIVPPSYKIWLGHITHNINDTFTFIWCEKGVCATSDGISVKDYSFLAEFADPVTCRELGWS